MGASTNSDRGIEFKPASLYLLRRLSSTVGGKSILIQVLTYPFALPAIASTPPSNAVLDPALPIPDANDLYDLYDGGSSTDFVVAASGIDQAIALPSKTSADVLVLANPPAENSATTLVPPIATTATTTVAITSSEVPLTAPAAQPVVWQNEKQADFQDAHLDYIYQIENSIPKEPENLPELEPEDALTLEATETEATETETAEIEAIKTEETEFSWFSIASSLEKDKPQKLTFVTQFESPTDAEDENLPTLIAGPQDFNPGLRNPSERSPSRMPEDSLDLVNPLLNNPTAEPSFSPDSNLTPSVESEPTQEASPKNPIDNLSNEPQQEERKAFVQWDNLEVGIDSNFDNFGQSSWSILPVLNGQLENGDRIAVISGFNQFEQDNFKSVNHVPLTLSWQGSVNDVELAVSGGADFFNRLPVDTHASILATAPIGKDATVSIDVAQGPYLFNAQTLENEVSRWQYGPELYWQIAPRLSLFSKLLFGNYSDGNWEQQSFSRLERTIDEEASVSLNLFNQSFQENVEDTSGYFSPSDFLVATAELSWKEQIAPGLSCGLLGSVGQQRLQGKWALAYSGQALCTVDVASALQIDLGYRFSNVSSDQSALVDDSAYSSQQIIGGIRVQF